MKVVVGLSGGVDSSVAAYLLQQQGHEVIGVFMRNWNDASVTLEDECPWIEDSNDALLVAQKLGIPFQVVDLSETYKERIVDYMFAEYEKGRTPNPDVLCNREIKFDIFLDIALSLGADKVATGHYAQVQSQQPNGKEIYQLLSGKDTSKDQSYFLCQLNQFQLSKALFPIGHLQKSEVRKIAANQGLITADKKDSQGLCFIGKVRLPDFLQQQLQPKKGKIIRIDADANLYQPSLLQQGDTIQVQKTIYTPEMGTVVGEHIGAHFFTIGQRKGLNVGGHKDPLFVIDTDVDHNIIYVGEGKKHPGLWGDTIFIPNEEAHWIREDLKDKVIFPFDVNTRIRYRQPLQKSQLIKSDDGYFIIFEEPISAITPGQFAACYLENELIFSGVIA